MARSISACTLIVLITATILTTPTKADTIYVDDDAPLGGDGTSWNTAFRDLQDALDSAAEGTTVRVAGGTYRPDRGTLDRTLSFELQEGVALYGGYAGLSDPNNPDARDFTAYPSILSGDLYGDDDAGGSCAFPWSDCCVPHSGAGCDSGDCSSRVCDGWCLEEGCLWWECMWWDPNTGECLDWVCMEWGCLEWAEELPWCCDPNNDWTEDCADAARTRCDECVGYSEEPSCENSLHVVRGYDIDSTTVLDGFVVARGNARLSDEPNDRGGGMSLTGASPTIRNCTFTDNHAKSGGAGAWSLSGSPSFTDCAFVGNGDHPYPWQPSGGGGIYVYGGSPTFTRCNFEANGASNGSGVCSGESTTTFVECTFHDNYGGDGGGGIYAYECTTTLVNCAFYGNTQPGVGGGGGLRVNGGALTAANCLFVGNSRGSQGAVWGDSGVFDFVNCIFHSNDNGGVRGYGSSTLTNCIVWNNTSYQLYPSVVATYSDVQDGWSGTGNIDADPAFVRDPSDGGDGWGDDISTPDVDEGANDDYGDLRLTSGSPCIDDGDNTALPPDILDLDGDGDTTEPLPFDLDGNPRFVDDPGMMDVGNGTPPIVDMGAYEFQDETCFGDLDADDDIDLSDLAQLLANYGITSGAVYTDGDLDRDGDVQLSDLAALLAVYGTTCP